jgi:cytochrome c1
MKTALIGALAGATALLTALTLAQEPPLRVLGLMKAVIIPASDAVFVVGKAPPKSEREWSAVDNGAARLIEAGKVLAKEAPPAGNADWIRLANAMADAAAAAGRAAKAKNVDAVLDAGDVLYTTCEDCHRHYVKK